MLFAAFVPTLGHAPDQRGVIRITVNLVQVDAVVTDSKGQQITELKPEDFEILEDGRPQKITNFSYVVLQPASRLPTGELIAKPSGPTLPVNPRRESVLRAIALVVDDLGLSFESTAYVREALKKFVDEQMQPGDLVAILRTAAGVGALQQFTSDKRMLYAAIDRVRWYPWGRSQVGAFAPIGSDPMDRAWAGGRRFGSRRALGGDLGRVSGEEARRLAGHLDVRRDPESAFRQEVFSVGTLGAINYIVKGMRELPGRKSAIVLSDGLPMFLGGESSPRIRDALRRLIDLANRSSVVIYTIDARGLLTFGLSAADNTATLTPEQIEEEMGERRNVFFDSLTGMAYLADETGGFLIQNTNDLNWGMARILEDLNGYYLLGYQPGEDTFSSGKQGPRYHKITVRVKAPGLHVRSRKGFYGISDEDAHPVYPTREEQMVAALTSPFGSGDVRFRLTGVFTYSVRTGPVVTYLLHIDARDFSFADLADGSKKTEVTILMVTFGDNGVIVDQNARAFPISSNPSEYQKILDDGLIYRLDVPIKKPGAYQLRVVVRDEGSGRVGSATQFIEVPDVKRRPLALSGLALRGAAGDHGGTWGNPAVRKFTPGSQLFYNYEIYGPRVDPCVRRPSLEAQAEVFRDGQQIYDSKPYELKAEGVANFNVLQVSSNLQLGTAIQPGDYILQVTVKDKLAKKKYNLATQWMDFEVVKQ